MKFQLALITYLALQLSANFEKPQRTLPVQPGSHGRKQNTTKGLSLASEKLSLFGHSDGSLKDST